MTLYLFDMDGTLTPPRQPMMAEFAIQFYEWQKTHKSFIATGSDFAKVKEQLPPSVIRSFKGIYSSMGNVLTAQENVIYQKEFSPEKELIVKLEEYRKNTEYPGELYDNYIEVRPGMVNFSVLGRNCPYEERNKYSLWDKTSHEREHIASELKKMFPQYDISIGGSISMDITPKGCGKEQIAHHLRESYQQEKIVFFGDKTFEGGNDYELAQALLKLENTEVVQVSSFKDVLSFINQEKD